MTKAVEIKYLIEVLGYIGDELANIADKPTVEINKDGVTPTEVATTLTQGDTTYSVGGGGGVTTEVIMGSLDRTYGTTPANYIGAFGKWSDIDDGKSFSDYDEIILVSCLQGDHIATGSKSRVFTRVPKYVLAYYDKLYNEYLHGNTYYVKYCLDYTNNKFYLDNWNYLCPIALLGVKY